MVLIYVGIKAIPTFIKKKRIPQGNRFSRENQSRTRIVCCKEASHAANNKCLFKCDMSLEEIEFRYINNICNTKKLKCGYKVLGLFAQLVIRMMRKYVSEVEEEIR